MKKLLFILLLLPFTVFGQTTYQLNYDSIRVNKTAGTGGTSLYGKVYLKNVGLGLNSDSILTVLNGRIRKVPVAGIFPTLGTSAISLGGTANGLSYSAGNYRLHKVTATTGGALTTGTDTIAGAKTLTGTLTGVASSWSGLMSVSMNDAIGTNISNNSATLPASISRNNGAGPIHSFFNTSGGVSYINNSGLLQTAAGTDSEFLRANGTVLGSTGTGAVARAASPTFTGTVNGANYNFTGTGVVQGGLTVGAAAYQNYSALYLGGSITTGSSQYGIITDNGMNGTSNFAFYANPKLRASTSATNTYGMYLQNPEMGAGATVTNNYGLYIENQTRGGTLNYSIYSAGGLNYLAGATTLANLAGTGTRMVVADNVGVLSTQAIPSGGGGGSVTSIGIANANGLAGTSDGDATNPTLTISTTVTGITKGNGTALSAATANTDYTLLNGTGLVSVNGSTTPVYNTTSSSISGIISDETGSGAMVFGTSPTIATPTVTGSLTNANSIPFVLSSPTTIDFHQSGSGTVRFINNTFGSVNMSLTNSGDMGVRGALTVAGAASASNLSGTNTGDQTTITGNAGTATALQTGRTISGTLFNGTSNITLNNTGITNGAGYITAASPALTGNPTAPTQTALDNSTKIATTAYVENAGTTKANLNSPALTGTPTAPTATAGTNNTQIATTAYVDRLGGGTVTSGRYSGVITGGTNVGGISYQTNGAHYNRIGNEVTVTGRCNLSTVASGASVFYIDLPVASNLGGGVDLLGNATSDANSSNLVIYADTGGDRATVEFTAAAAANMEIYYNFTYTIL
jgi:hypothetical protein